MVSGSITFDYHQTAALQHYNNRVKKSHHLIILVEEEAREKEMRRRTTLKKIHKEEFRRFHRPNEFLKIFENIDHNTGSN